MTFPGAIGIAELELVATGVSADEYVKVHSGDLTLLVGPNNSGKSLALREIKEWASIGEGQPARGVPLGKVLRRVVGRFPDTPESLDRFLSPKRLPRRDGDHEAMIRLRVFYFHAGPRPMSPGPVLVREWDGIEDVGVYSQKRLLPIFCTLLDGRSRLALVDQLQWTTLREPPANHMMMLLRDEQIHKRVEEELFDAFGQHLVIDVTQPPNLSIALSPDPTPPDGWQTRLDEASIAYQQAATPIREFGDGVQSYVGIVCAIETLGQSLLLIDEPEAFLHPALSRRLGRFIARSASEHRASVVVATHSGDLVMGCIDEVPETGIVRLGYNGGTGSARPLSGSDVAELSRDPLLRSSHALSALFARGVVVCEADSDRAFYEEINRRLIEEGARRGATDTMFLNAQNWQTVVRLMGPLRAFGIRTACVLDLETVTRQEHWTDIARVVTSSDSQRGSFLQNRARAGELLDSMGLIGNPPNVIKRCKRDGLAGLEDEAKRSEVRQVLRDFAACGVFVVPVGELESWLPQLGVKNKKTWLSEILERMGSRSQPIYVRPTVGDVWDFVESLADWITAPG